MDKKKNMTKEMKKEHEVIFSTRDELTKVCFSDVMYAEADGNYVILRLCGGRNLNLLASLQNIEQITALDERLHFVRAGRSYIINVDYISQINTVKRIITIADDATLNTMVLSLPKEAVKQLKQDLTKQAGAPVPEFETHNGSMEAYVMRHEHQSGIQ